MNNRSLLASFRFGAARLFRFGIVGVAATIVYFTVATLLGRPPIDMDPVKANAVGVAASLLISYIGHHRFTFRVSGDHGYYLTRFLIMTTLLFILSSGIMALLRYVWKIDHTVATAGIAVGYPIVSYILNLAWTFVEKADDKAQ